MLCVVYTFLGLNDYWLEVNEVEVALKMEGLTMNRETQESIPCGWKNILHWIIKPYAIAS